MASSFKVFWNWDSLEYAPLYSRYEIDSTSASGWVQLDGNKNSIFLNVDQSEKHIFYFETTYDGFVWSNPSQISLEAKDKSQKLELGNLVVSLDYKNNEITVTFDEEINQIRESDFIFYFCEKTNIDPSLFSFNNVENSFSFACPDYLYNASPEVTNLLVSLLYNEWKAQYVADDLATENLGVNTPYFNGKFIFDDYPLMVSLKNNIATITSDKIIPVNKIISFVSFAIDKLNLNIDDFKYQLSEKSAIIIYPNYLNSIGLNNLQTDLAEVYKQWKTIVDSPTLEEVLKEGQNQSMKIDFEGYSINIKLGEILEISSSQSISEETISSLMSFFGTYYNFSNNEYAYRINGDVLEISYPYYFKKRTLTSLQNDVIKGLKAWYAQYTNNFIAYQKNFFIGSEKFEFVVDSEKATITTETNFTKDSSATLINYLEKASNQEIGTLIYKIDGKKIEIKYPKYFEKESINQIESKLIPVITEWKNNYGLTTSELPTKEMSTTKMPKIEIPMSDIAINVVTSVKEPVDIVVPAENNDKIVKPIVDTKDKLLTTNCFTVYYAQDNIQEFNFNTTTSSYGLDFTRDFYPNGNKFGIGYLIGTNFAINSAERYYGIKLGIDSTFAFNKNKNFAISTDLGAIGSLSETDLLKIDFSNVKLGAFVGVGIKIKLNNNIMLGIKCNYNYYF